MTHLSILKRYKKPPTELADGLRIKGGVDQSFLPSINNSFKLISLI
jgi:hypothetical protein